MSTKKKFKRHVTKLRKLWMSDKDFINTRENIHKWEINFHDKHINIFLRPSQVTLPKQRH